MVVMDVNSNQLGGTLNDFAFQAAANRADVHSGLRYFDIGNNSFAGMSLDIPPECQGLSFNAFCIPPPWSLSRQLLTMP